jgi:hypothetical protein
MTRPQWLLVVFIGLIATVAYIRSDQVARRVGLGQDYPRADRGFQT